jgi:hypothetical protein
VRIEQVLGALAADQPGDGEQRREARRIPQ